MRFPISRTSLCNNEKLNKYKQNNNQDIDKLLIFFKLKIINLIKR